jgi:hypothetical protein
LHVYKTTLSFTIMKKTILILAILGSLYVMANSFLLAACIMPDIVVFKSRTLSKRSADPVSTLQQKVPAESKEARCGRKKAVAFAEPTAGKPLLFSLLILKPR